MDRNAFLAFALSFLVLSLWMTYEAKQRPVPVPETVAEQQQPPQPPIEVAPGATPAQQPAGAEAPRDVPVAAVEPNAAEQIFVVEHPLHRTVFTSRGAGIRHFELLQYTQPASEGGGPVVLIDRTETEAPALATPLPEIGFGDLGRADFQLVSSSPRELVFERTQSGVLLRKTFTFEEDSYRFRMRLEVANAGGGASVAPAFGVVLPVRAHPGADFRDLTISVLSQGSVERELLAGFGQPGFFSRQPELERRFQGDVEWAAGHSHYFLTAVMPDVPRDALATSFAFRPGEEAQVTVSQPPAAILPGTSLTREYALFFGPKEPDLLGAVGAQLDRSIDLGWSWIAPLTRGFIWLLKACYSIVPNFGVAIIILTVLVRLVTAPLAAKQMKSMKRMSELQPKLKELQDKHKDDKQAQSQEMMKLYREAGVNPLGGCFPILLQFPVFIGLYYALQSSIDLRQAPFMLWIDDLSRPETLFTIPGVGWPVRVLPILMSLSMVLQQKMTPTTSMDPTQARTMMIVMPVMFFFMFYGFPSGLVLYWFVSNLLAIAQQVWLNRQVAPTPA
ncbi:MAG: membrane protein insertase YidC [Myxococcota bacterium]|nr:membrane protein insertase YidC [Myxococcota bacterium]